MTHLLLQECLKHPLRVGAVAPGGCGPAEIMMGPTDFRKLALRGYF